MNRHTFLGTETFSSLLWSRFYVILLCKLYATDPPKPSYTPPPSPLPYTPPPSPLPYTPPPSPPPTPLHHHLSPIPLHHHLPLHPSTITSPPTPLHHHLSPIPLHHHLSPYTPPPSPLSMALASFVFHSSATSLARGSSGLGALRRAWMDRRTVLIWRAGLHLSAGPGRRGKVKHGCHGYTQPLVTTN